MFGHVKMLEHINTSKLNKISIYQGRDFLSLRNSGDENILLK